MEYKLRTFSEADRKAFILGANKGSIEPKPKSETKKMRVGGYIQIVVYPNLNEKRFFDDIVALTGKQLGYLLYLSYEYANKEPLPLEYIDKHFSFVYNKNVGKYERIRFTIQEYVNTKEITRNLVDYYRSLSLPLGNKGVILLYLVNYVENCLNMDISKYENI
ncbi:hypothetical protein [Lonepinella sp. BR2882]|uniref:hypothetical protein n=1 Tax=Lonepinella sp. BR2882 TaxID=3095283 RepID=UPI003F6DAC2A